MALGATAPFPVVPTATSVAAPAPAPVAHAAALTPGVVVHTVAPATATVTYAVALTPYSCSRGSCFHLSVSNFLLMFPPEL